MTPGGGRPDTLITPDALRLGDEVLRALAARECRVPDDLRLAAAVRAARAPRTG